MWHVNNASEMKQHDEEQSKLRQQPRILGIKRDSNYEANLKERLLWREMQRAEREGNNRFFLGISDSSELRHTPASVEGNKQARGESGVMSGRLEEKDSMSVGHELKDMSGGIEEEEKVPQFQHEGIYQQEITTTATTQRRQHRDQNGNRIRDKESRHRRNKQKKNKKTTTVAC